MMPMFDTHVVFISGQQAPNFLPLCDPDFQPKKIVMFVSNQMTENARHFQVAVKQAFPSIELQEVPLSNSYDVDVLEKEIQQTLCTLDLERTVINVTGGTKLMALVAMSLGCPCFYLPTGTYQLAFFHLKDNEDKLYRLKLTHFKLRSYMRLFQYEVKKQVPVSFVKAQLDLCDQLLGTDSYEKCVPILNALASSAKESKSLSVETKGYGDCDLALQALLDQCEKAQLLSVSGHRIHFKSEQARAFLNGGWLEHRVYDYLCKKLRNKANDDSQVFQGLEIVHEASLKPSGQVTPGGNNELDVVMWYKGYLVLVECKTCKIDDTNHQKFIDKIQSLKSKFGIQAIAVIVSYLKVNYQPFLTKAQNDHVVFINGRKELEHLLSRIDQKIGVL